MSWEAIVFDFDGVLTDSEPLHYETFKRVLARRGMQCSWDEYCSVYIGFDDREGFETCYAQHGLPLDPVTLRNCIREKADLFAALVTETDIQPYPGVVDFIRDLRSLDLPLALCSGALRGDIIPILEKFGILDAFAVLSTAEDVTRSKPSPEPYRHAIRCLQDVTGKQISAENCVAFEDTKEGMASARGAGLKVIAVTHSHQHVDFTDVLCTICGFEGFNSRKLKHLYLTESVA